MNKERFKAQGARRRVKTKSLFYQHPEIRVQYLASRFLESIGVRPTQLTYISAINVFLSIV